MKIFKFIVPSKGWVTDPDDPNTAWRGVVAATVAENADEAKINLVRYAAENGLDARWLKVARCVELPLQAGVVIAWAEE